MSLHKNAFKTLLYKYNLDVGAYFLPKKKFSYQLTRKILHQFAFFIKRNTIDSFRKLGINPVKQINTPRFLEANPVFSNFFQLCFKYHFFRSQLDTKENRLLSYWMGSHLQKLNKFLPTKLYYLHNRYFFSLNKKLPYVTTPKFLDSQLQLIDYFTTHYCFHSKARFKTFYRKYEVQCRRFANSLNFGAHSLLINQLFLTNSFPTTKFCYTLIRLGGVFVNKKICKSPHRLIKVYDSFFISPPFLRLTSHFFLQRLKKERIIFNVPNYFVYDYSTFFFYIWRKPTKEETYFLHFYPFSYDTLYFPSFQKFNSIYKMNVLR